MIKVGFSKTISLFTYTLFTNKQTSQSVNDHINNSTNLHISIQVNRLSHFDDVVSYEQQSTRLLLDDDDDDELIKLDMSSIVASNFCENNLIELRLDQDMEYDNDIANEIKN
ncbi:unnamed protein product [Rotaria sordida]|uniref:Uncharacterized protein n=1 Tax=Rotaria sordida TaxID=392033 RepID=A0A813N3M2_9BILA|nr:unnamed protein product [Rotaria sordida]CAF1190699.1 unnamed protein product [Rotaria sordida]